MMLIIYLDKLDSFEARPFPSFCGAYRNLRSTQNYHTIERQVLELIRPPRNGFGKYLHAPGDAVQNAKCLICLFESYLLRACPSRCRPLEMRGGRSR